MRFELPVYILNAAHVPRRITEAHLGLFLAQLVAGNARCLFKDDPATARIATKDFFYASLSDEGVGLLAYTCVKKQFRDVPQPAGLAVNEVLSIACAIHPTGDGHLAEV